MIKKMDKAIKILHREQKRRESLPIKNRKYIAEVVFLRTFIRSLYRKLALGKVKKGKYPILLSESQWSEIQEFYELRYNTSQPRYMAQALLENYSNLQNQIKALKGE